MEWIKERVGDGAGWAYFSVSLDLSKLIYLHSKGNPDLYIWGRSIIMAFAVWHSQEFYPVLLELLPVAGGQSYLADVLVDRLSIY